MKIQKLVLEACVPVASIREVTGTEAALRDQLALAGKYKIENESAQQEQSSPQDGPH